MKPQTLFLYFYRRHQMCHSFQKSKFLFFNQQIKIITDIINHTLQLEITNKVEEYSET